MGLFIWLLGLEQGSVWLGMDGAEWKVEWSGNQLS